VLEVLCPWSIGDRFVAPSALKRDVSVVEGSNVDFSAVLDRGACETREPRTVRGHWRGRYSSAFEESQFTPCPVDPITREVRSYGHPFGRRAWVNFSKTVWKKPGLGGLAFDSTNSRDYGFVEWSGTLYGPEKSGHMGMSNYLLTVDSIFRMSPTGECDVR
jgi:hypothetical protein